MESLSTKPQRVPMFSAFLRSRRIRGLIFLLVSLFGLYYLFLNTTKHLGTTSTRVELNGEGEPLDLTQDTPQRGDSDAGQETPMVVLEKRIQHLIDTNRIMVFSKSYCP
ncbi:hypothetical protein BGZ54_005663, partial [Gamsiella multidivaricata]